MAAARTPYAGSDKPSYSHSPAIPMFLGDFLEPVPFNVWGIIMEHLHTLYAATPQSTEIQPRKARHEISVLSEERWQPTLFYYFFPLVGGWCVWVIHAPQKLEQRRLPWQRFSSFSYRSETLPPPHSRRHGGGHMRYDYPGDRSELPGELTCVMLFFFL